MTQDPEFAKGAFEATPRKQRPHAVPCPICDAVTGAPCLTRGGRRAHYSHEARKRAAS